MYDLLGKVVFLSSFGFPLFGLGYGVGILSVVPFLILFFCVYSLSLCNLPGVCDIDSSVNCLIGCEGTCGIVLFGASFRL